MWSGSILKDDPIEKVFEMLLKNAGSIQGGKIGDGSTTISEGGGELAGSAEPPKPDDVEEKEKEKQIAQVVQQQQTQLPTQQLKSAMPHNGWFQSMFGKDAESMVKELRMARRIKKICVMILTLR